MPDDRERVTDPLGVERDHAKADDDLPKPGPPMARMATTYGSSFVTSEEQADSLATEPSPPAGPPLGDGGDPGGASNAAPAERPPQQTRDRSGQGD